MTRRTDRDPTEKPTTGASRRAASSPKPAAKPVKAHETTKPTSAAASAADAKRSKPSSAAASAADANRSKPTARPVKKQAAAMNSTASTRSSAKAATRTKPSTGMKPTTATKPSRASKPTTATKRVTQSTRALEPVRASALSGRAAAGPAFREVGFERWLASRSWATRRAMLVIALLLLSASAVTSIAAYQSQASSAEPVRRAFDRLGDQDFAYPSTVGGLTITSPADRAVVATEKVTVLGTAPGESVIVRNTRFAPDADYSVDDTGLWGVRIKLHPGLNTISFRVGDDKSTTSTIRVIYDPSAGEERT